MKSALILSRQRRKGKMFEETNGRLRQSQSIFDSLDNVNFSKEIGFPPVSYLAKNDLAESFKGFCDEANRHGSHIIAFYDSMNRLKASAIPVGDFRFKVGYHLNSDEKIIFLEIWHACQRNRKQEGLFGPIILRFLPGSDLLKLRSRGC